MTKLGVQFPLTYHRLDRLLAVLKSSWEDVVPNLLKAVLCLVPLIATSLIGCKDRISDGGGFTTVSGTVIDSLSGEPFDSARITILDTLTLARPIFSDSLGHWHHWFPGTATITYYCQKDGYHTKSAVVSSTRENESFSGVDFLLLSSGE